MRTIRFLLQKEFLQIFRNKGMLPIIFVMPVVQLIILSNAATFELNKVNFYLVDHNHSTTSQELVSHFESTGYFKLNGYSQSVDDGIQSILAGRDEMVLTIPPNFERDLKARKHADLQLIINGVDGSIANLILSYSQSIIGKYNASIQPTVRQLDVNHNVGQINVQSVNWYNPELNYINYMVPGILVVLVTMIGMFLSGMNIVREREIGTIEQLNVTPIKRYQFITGKLLPFWIIGLFEMAFGLGIARWGFGIPFVGSFWLVMLITAIYLLAVQGLGLLISTMTDTQQQAMFIAWFISVVFILMGGLFTPIESMPIWAQRLTWINPIAYFIEIMRMVLLKGAGIKDIWELTTALLVMAGIVLTLAISRYRKASV